MKILAVSDRVMDQLYCSDVRSKYPDVDMIIGCGDLPFYYLDFLVSAMDVPLFYVRGNHDRGPQYTITGKVLEQVPGGVDLHGSVIRHNGLLIAGLEGSMRYRPGAPFMYTEAEMRREIARLIPRLLWNKQRHGRYLDLLITHSPPFGIHDRPDLPHTGFKVFLNVMKLFKPKVLLHGHIHIYRRTTQVTSVFEETTILNVYPYRLVDLNALPEPPDTAVPPKTT